MHQLGVIRDIDIDQNEVFIETSDYCCGEHDTHFYNFPSSYLLKTDEELHRLFAAERVEYDQRVEREKAEKLEKERLKQEAVEREQLKRLLQKYGDIR